MEKRIFFEDARKNVLEMFSVEFPTMKIADVDLFIGQFYRLVNYEEESQKIRPTIIITSNVNALVKHVAGAKKITFYEDADTSNFKARLKALMCFCMNGWYMYINFGETIIEYGIIKKLTSIKDKTLIQDLTNKDTLETISKRTSLVVLTVQGGGVCKLVGAKGHNCSVCFNLNASNEYNWENEIYEFVEACVSKIKTTQKKLNDIKNLLFNIYQRVLRDLHGTICLVVDKEFKDKTGFLADGTWLKEPIEFVKLFLRSNKADENVLRSFADVLTTMMDFDGITILDNAGRIRAYNVFIESSVNAQKVVGGARRRAAYTLLQSKLKRIIGVYFQSQDGDNFYKERSDLRKKKKIKIVGGNVIADTDDMLPLEIIANLQLAKKKEEEKERERLEKERLEKERLELEKQKLEEEKRKLEEEKQKLEEEKLEHELHSYEIQEILNHENLSQHTETTEEEKPLEGQSTFIDK